MILTTFISIILYQVMVHTKIMLIALLSISPVLKLLLIIHLKAYLIHYLKV